MAVDQQNEALVRRPPSHRRCENGRRRWRAFRTVVEEVCAVAAAEGIELPSDTANRTFSERLEPTGYSSLYDDLTNGRRMKLEALHGTVVRRAHRHEIRVPVSETIYAILRPWAVRNEIAAL
jgi:2-dehydropantoate 2-reductase